LVIAMVMALAGSGAAQAFDPQNPTWPCVQRKVAEVSLPAVWSGPPIDDVGKAWEEDGKVRDLVARLAQRRTPIEEAQSAITDFVAGADREQKGKLLFAGVFERLNRDRGEIINGIERLAKRQQEFADRIRANAAELRTLQEATQRDQGKLDELTNQIEWGTRIFEDRRKTIRYVCEVPVLIEQRLFALGRAIQQAIE
jgi:hypothetical protein